MQKPQSWMFGLTRVLLPHSALSWLVLASCHANSSTISKVSFCPRMKTFRPITADWRLIGGWVVGATGTSHSFISGSTADTAGTLIRGKVGSQMSPLVRQPQSTRVQKYKGERKRVRAIGSVGCLLRTSVSARAETLGKFLCSLFQHSCSTEWGEEGDSFCSVGVSWWSRLKSLHRCYLFQVAIFMQHKSCVEEIWLVRVRIRQWVQEDFETRSTFSSTEILKIRPYTTATEQDGELMVLNHWVIDSPLYVAIVFFFYAHMLWHCLFFLYKIYIFIYILSFFWAKRWKQQLLFPSYYFWRGITSPSINAP